MNEFVFEPATRAQSKARIALAGPSGSGKTYTALAIATAFGGKIAVIDTERGSASKYAKIGGRGLFGFDRLNMQRYDPRDLPRALAAAAAGGYATVIVDSLSKFWGGQGGMLEQVDNAAKRGYGGNSFGGWKEARPMETAMIEAILSYPGHVIVTMRTKTAYEILEDERGRKVPTKIGLKPEQRDGIEYEFDIVGDMDLENTLTVSKSRCPELSGEVIRRPGAEFAKTVLAWLGEGEPVLTATDYRADALAPDATYAGLRELYLTVKSAGLLGAAVADEHGDAMSLGDLIVCKGKEAEARETFGAAASTNGSDSDPAAASQSQALGDQWLPMARDRALTLAGDEEFRALWADISSALTAGVIAKEDADELAELMKARKADGYKSVHDENAAAQSDCYGLLETDPWLPKVRSIESGRDAEALMADAQKSNNLGSLSKLGLAAVVQAIALKRSELTDRAAA